jgi:alkaline phosphatase
MKKIIIFIIFSVLLINCSSQKYTKQGLYFKIPITHIIPKTENPEIFKAKDVNDGIPKSIIYIIADGAGIGQFTLHYYTSEESSFGKFDHVGLQTTHPLDKEKRVTDSAAAGTALATGKKVYRKNVSYLDGEPIKTVIEWAEELKMATGLIATAKVNHATPATFGSHAVSRYDYDDIFVQLLQSEIDIILGGGAKYMNDSMQTIANQNNVSIVYDFDKVKSTEGKIMGLFADDALDLDYANRFPTTLDMTISALEKLESNGKGFFLMVEESQIDWAGHINNAGYIKSDMQSLEDLTKYCLDYQSKHPDVLVILTADHETGGVAVYDEDKDNLSIQYIGNHHSANFVPIFATGPGASAFDTIIDNSEIGKQLIKYVRNRD